MTAPGRLRLCAMLGVVELAALGCGEQGPRQSESAPAAAGAGGAGGAQGGTDSSPRGGAPGGALPDGGRDGRGPAATIFVDARAPGTPLQRVWEYHGFDEVNYTTTPAGEGLLATLSELHRAPPYVRSHFLLNSDDGEPGLKWGSTNIYTEDSTGSPQYDFTTIDRIMDTLIRTGTRPFVEIGFMPRDLSVHPDPYRNLGPTTLDGGCFYPPDDYDRWGALIGAWVEHTRQRYEAVDSTWQWELWNEPDIGYWRGTFEEFARLYDVTEAALHQVLPRAEFGGPAVANAGGPFMTQFLEHCSTGTNAVTGEQGTRLDLITFHAKGGVIFQDDHVQMNLASQLRQHQNGMNAVAAVPAFRNTPIVVSEADPDGCAACPATFNPANGYRTSPAYGAYVVAMMKHSLELADRIGVALRGVLTWAFLFEDAPYFAGYRALETNGIHLPVLNAFKLLGRLGGDRLPATSTGALGLDGILTIGVRDVPEVDVIATREGGSVHVLVYHYHDDLVAAEPARVSLDVALPPDIVSPVSVTHWRVDEAHGDAHSAWVAQGRPAEPTGEQLEELRDAMEPAQLELPREVELADGAFHLEFELPRFGLSLVTLTSAHVQEGAGGASAGGTSGAGGISAEGARGGDAAVGGAGGTDNAGAISGTAGG